MDLKTHCLFCLEKQDPQIVRTLLLENPKNIQDFQPLVNYLTSEDGVNSTFNFNNEPKVCKIEKCDSGSDLPTMCPTCYDLLANLNRLKKCIVEIRALIEDQVGQIKKVVKEAATDTSSLPESSRRQKYFQFLREKSNAMPPDVVLGMKNLINDFHGAILKTDCRAEQTGQRQQDEAKEFHDVDGYGQIVKKEPFEFPNEDEEPGEITAGDLFDNHPFADYVLDHDYDYDQDSDDSYGPSNSDSEMEKPQKKKNTTRKETLKPKVKVKRSKEKYDEDEDNDDNELDDKRGCDICREVVVQAEMSQHIEKHLGHPGWPCLTCGHVFATRSLLLSHLKNIVFRCKQKSADNPWWTAEDQKLSLVCRACPSVFSEFKTETDLMKHVFETHEKNEDATKNDRYRCKKCLRSFCTEDGLQFHFNYHIHRSKKQNIGYDKHPMLEGHEEICRVCGTRVLKGMLGVHMKVTHSSQEDPNLIECRSCSQRINKVTSEPETWFCRSLKAYFRHQEMIHRLQKKPCHICSQEFTVLLALLEHYRDVHQEGVQVQCEHCSKTFHLRRHLMDHLKACHQLPDAIPCELCLRDVGDIPRSYFRSQKLLDDHIKHYHREDRFKCQRCSSQFSSKLELQTHETESHQGEPLICHKCSKQFLHHFDLKKHLRIHTAMEAKGRRKVEGEPKKKLYQCDVEGCGKRFSVSTALQSHKNYVHCTEKNFICHDCGNRFKTQDSLKRHEKTHVPGGPPRNHICDTCGRGFTMKRILEAHIRIHTGERPFKCDVCGNAFRQRIAMRTHRKLHDKPSFRKKSTHERGANRFK